MSRARVGGVDDVVGCVRRAARAGRAGSVDHAARAATGAPSPVSIAHASPSASDARIDLGAGADLGAGLRRRARRALRRSVRSPDAGSRRLPRPGSAAAAARRTSAAAGAARRRAGGRARRRARGAGTPKIFSTYGRVEAVGHRRAERRARTTSANVSALARRSGLVSDVARERGRERGGSRRTRSAARGGNATQRPAMRMRPWRGRRCRSSPSSSRRVAMIGAGVDGCRRWLPWSTRTPATSKLPARPPTCASRSRTSTRRPVAREAQGGAEPGRARAEHDDVERVPVTCALLGGEDDRRRRRLAPRPGRRGGTRTRARSASGRGRRRRARRR